MKNIKTNQACATMRRGFTLVELMVTIAIIGILAGTVMVSMSGSVEKSKNASAITTMSSLLPEIVTCQDDGGGLTAFSAGVVICTAAGHSATWPNAAFATKTGYTISASVTTNANIPAYSFTATNGTRIITCVYANNECTST